jgi:hypothetical protein
MSVNYVEIKSHIEKQIRNFFNNTDLYPYEEDHPGDYRVIDLGDKLKFKLIRSQSYSTDETTIIKGIESVIKEYLHYQNTQIFDEISNLIPIKAISYYFNKIDSNYDPHIITELIILIDSFASQTYEGRRLSLSISINPSSKDGKILFSEYFSHDFSKVLGYSLETIIDFDSMGNFLNYSENIIKDKDVYSPYFYSSIASQSKNKLIISLNYNGDILLFNKGQLLFSKRRGFWKFYHFDAILKQVSFGNKHFDESIRKEIILSCLDISFAKSGGCIAFINKKDKNKVITIISKDDIIQDETSIKTKAVKRFLNGMKFQNISRLQRKELIGIDGATIIDDEGNIIAVGAIIKLNERSHNGGGRTASAKELAKYGTSFKISNDGPIIAYDNDDELSIG